MLFNSVSYFVFFPLFTFLYFRVTKKNQWIVLLVASCGFYMAFVPGYIVILGALILVDYLVGIALEDCPNKWRKSILVISIVSNVGFLAFFKYIGLFDPIASKLVTLFHGNHAGAYGGLLLPIGLSFHTFQSMSYTFEVYYGRSSAERHLGIYALYVMFFPQLVAGPIERPQTLLPQLKKTVRFNSFELPVGLRRILWGLIKKVVVADNIGKYLVTLPFAHPDQMLPDRLMLAAVGFSIQIYCDFSGYCDIAIGSAKILGISLSENFKSPYRAASLIEFWKRWHITLTSWFRDYVYLPLGGSAKGAGRTFCNVVFIFVLSGIWHGANLTFVLWGLWHATGYLVQRGLRYCGMDFNLNVHFCRWITFLFVSLGWIFFRSPSVENATVYFRRLGDVSLWQSCNLSVLGSSLAFFSVLYGVWASVPDSYRLNHAILQWKRPVRWFIYLLGCWSLLNFGVIEETPFIYFQF